MKKWCRHIPPLLLPLLFAAYMAGITLFTHSHVVNGVTLVHSHPFKKSAQHSHSPEQYQLLDWLNHVAVTEFLLTPLLAAVALILLRTLRLLPLRAVCCTACPNAIHLRAPPVVCFA